MRQARVAFPQFSLSSKFFLQFSGLIIALLIFSSASAAPNDQQLPPALASAEESEALWQAYQARYQQQLTLFADDPLADLFEPVLDTAFISADGKTGVLWLALRDYTGRILATEPGVVFAKRQADTWQIVFSSDKEWTEIKTSLAADFLPASFQAPPESATDQAEINYLSGYYLPYVQGTKHRLEGSILHFHDYPPLGYPSCAFDYCHYAYDFTDAGHFPLVASKAGVVISSRDSCYDGNTSCTNYIILQDSVGGAYQIYLHLAYNTIPDYLTAGTFVDRGKYIGDTDDTGYSTSEHVHFMVVTSWWYGASNYPWGASVDIRFTDVTINNGIPRTCYEVTNLPFYDGATLCNGNPAIPFSPLNDWFISGNVGASPPTGHLTRPAAGAIVAPGANPLMDVTAQTSDDVRVVRAVLIAKINGSWREVAPRVTNPSANGVFDWDVNLCKAGDLNGPLEVALKIWDHEGNITSMLSPRTINVDDACAFGVMLPLILSK